jgi:hypothetical protein
MNLKDSYWGKQTELLESRDERRNRMKSILLRAHQEYLKLNDKKSNTKQMDEILAKSNQFIFKVGQTIVCDRAFQVLLGIALFLISLFISFINFLFVYFQDI